MSDAKAFINPKSGSIRITGVVDIVDADGNVRVALEVPVVSNSEDEGFNWTALATINTTHDCVTDCSSRISR